jgi:hypothetical protein
MINLHEQKSRFDKFSKRFAVNEQKTENSEWCLLTVHPWRTPVVDTLEDTHGGLRCRRNPSRFTTGKSFATWGFLQM